MKYTTNKNLKLPEYTDVIDIENLNENFSAIDEFMGSDVSDESGIHGLRYNKETEQFEVYNGTTSEWEPVTTSGGSTDTSGFATTEYVDSQIGDIATILDNINGEEV